MHSEMNMLWKAIYFIPVIPVYGVIIFVTYTFTEYYINDGRDFTNTKLFSCVFFYLFAIMTIISHTLSMIIGPGSVDQNVLKSYLDTDKIDSNREEYKEFFCNKCNKHRPGRSHHCSTCRKCVLKMDHHCPWIFNCVGFKNQKAFYLFLFYAAFGDLIACVCLGTKILDPNFVNLLLRPRRRMNPYADNIFLEVLYSMKDPLMIIGGATLSFCMTIAIGVLFGYQTYLIMNNLTSIENSHYRSKHESPYYFSNKISNLKSVLGFNVGLFWFIPYFKSNKLNNGYSYPVQEIKNSNGENKNSNNTESCCEHTKHD